MKKRSTAIVRFLIGVFAVVWSGGCQGAPQNDCPAPEQVTSACSPESQVSEPGIELYVPDGQLRSNPVRVFLNRNVSSADHPVLRFYSAHEWTKQDATENNPQPFDYVAPGQSWTTTVNGQEVTKTGTVFLVNASCFPIEPYKPMKRVTAVLQWTSDGKPLCAVASHAVNLANPTSAWAWSITTVLVLLVCLIIGAKAATGSALKFLCADDGHLSLSLTQVALWTIAVGTVTLFYGLIRLQIPIIPDSILILMGLSLTTGGLGTWAPPQKKRTDAPAPQQSDTLTQAKAPSIWDLIVFFPRDGAPQPSLARAQMLFWTVLIIALFVSKSAIDGVLWDVPTVLVALMGISQAGYVGPKFLGPYASDETAAPAAAVGESGTGAKK